MLVAAKAAIVPWAAGRTPRASARSRGRRGARPAAGRCRLARRRRARSARLRATARRQRPGNGQSRCRAGQEPDGADGNSSRHGLPLIDVIRCEARRWGPAGRPGWRGRRRRSRRSPTATTTASDDRRRRDGDRVVDQVRQHDRADDAECRAEHAAGESQHRCLDEELPPDHRRRCAQRLAQARSRGCAR